jgi:hypothetical protein
MATREKRYIIYRRTKPSYSSAPVLMPIILAIEEAEIRRIVVSS